MVVFKSITECIILQLRYICIEMRAFVDYGLKVSFVMIVD